MSGIVSLQMHTFSSLNIDHSSLLIVHEQSNFNYFVLYIQLYSSFQCFRELNFDKQSYELHANSNTGVIGNDVSQ